MKESQMIAALAALAHEGRLKLFRKLIRAGLQGHSCGALATLAKVGITTASAQLQVLAHAGLVTSQRQGKSVIYRADYHNIGGLLSALLKDCCAGSHSQCTALCRDIESTIESTASKL